MDGGQQFQPPQMPSSMPDYQGGNNQPPLNQDNGVSIYNSGNPQAPQQVPGQQGGQQPQQAQQPQHGNQIPDYQTATPYTQGPGQANPDYQAPQQGNQPQQGQQPQQQQPSQAPTQTQQPQNKQDDSTQQLDQKKQQCQAAAVKLAATSATTTVPSFGGGGGRSPIWWFEPALDPAPVPTPPCPQGCPEVTQKPGDSDAGKLEDVLKRLKEAENKISDLEKKADTPKQCKKSEVFVGLTKTVFGFIGVGIAFASIPVTFGADSVLAIAGMGGAGTLAYDGMDQMTKSGC